MSKMMKSKTILHNESNVDKLMESNEILQNETLIYSILPTISSK